MLDSDGPQSAKVPTIPLVRPVLTVAEVARELGCSKAHVHNIINGKVRGTLPLPSLTLGRRRLVRRTSLDEWIRSIEQCYDPIRPGFIAKTHGKD